MFPPCGATALAAEIDHTRAVTDHGLTLPDNLGPACGHDHDLKDRGWTLAQPRPGVFRWTSPTGHTYERGPRPVVDDLPAPRPPATPSSTEPPVHADDGPVWDDPPPSAPAEPPPPPARAPEEDPDPPPF
ncbi:HNH endonuclease signature motif containing protein [Actinomycetospora straminea]|uniref:HNH endonuclease signature motif containing protein n=1 Tax=Actinomycetospora straminea TaxID=663607 RepID=UPI0031EC4702